MATAQRKFPEVNTIFRDLEAYHDYCRFELAEFNPADLYREDSATYQAYLASKRPRRPYMGNKPRYDNRNNDNRNYDNRRSY